jgi:hypothetical protein
VPKRIAIFIVLFCAFSLLQAHNMIPHHHDDAGHAGHHHHHDGTGHSHDDQPDDESPFNSFNHDATFGKVLMKAQLVKAEFFPYSADAFLPTITIKEILAFRGPPPKRGQVKNQSLIPSSYSYAVPLRAPPYCS